MIYRRAIVLALVLFSALELPACTTYNRMWDMHDELHSPEMNKRIAEAQQK